MVYFSRPFQAPRQFAGGYEPGKLRRQQRWINLNAAIVLANIMRILIASNYQWPHIGGIENVAQQLKNCWENLGHQVTWLTTDIPRGARAATPDNVRFPAFNWPEAMFQINTPIVNPLAYFKISDLVRAHDAVNVQSLALGVTALAIRAAFACKKPLVVTQHVAAIPLKSRLLTFLQARVIQHLARAYTERGAWLTFVNPVIRDWFVTNANINPACVCMTPAAYNEVFLFSPDETTRRAGQRRLGLPEHRLRVLFVGRFLNKKGLPLIESVARAYPDIHFTLVGEGSIRPQAWHLANVRVEPPHPAETLRLFYASHDLLLLPSVGEGWPAVICEAMACGTPCLISRDTFRNYGRDEAMFLVSDNSAASLAGILRRVQAGNIPLVKQRENIAKYARATWNWNWMKTAQTFIDLYKSRPPRFRRRPGLAF